MSSSASAVRPAGTRPAPQRQASPPSTLRAYGALTKPGITRLVVVTAGVSWFLGAPEFDGLALINLLFGTALVASGANAFNQILERRADALMRRTADRPLPSGRLGIAEALIFSTALSFIGVVHLYFLINPLTALVVLVSLLSYTLVYTPMKKRTWWATLAGAVPGALPALAGWAAATHTLSRDGWLLFAIVFVWQMPHFFALGWMYREDYARGGFRLLSSIDPTGARTANQTLLYILLLLPVSVLPAWSGLMSWVYAAGALALGLAFMAPAITLWRDLARGHARRVFVASILYLPALLALMVVDRVL